MTETLIATVTTALLAGSVPAWWNARMAVAAERRAARRNAAADMSAPLRQMRLLLRQHGRVTVDRHEVAAVISDWDFALDRHRHLLPTRWSGVNRSVRDAFTTVFGAAALADSHPDLSHGDLAEPDYLWQDFGDEYLGYVNDALLRWGQNMAPAEFHDYDTWLRITERHDPVALGWRGRGPR